MNGTTASADSPLNQDYRMKMKISRKKNNILEEKDNIDIYAASSYHHRKKTIYSNAGREMHWEVNYQEA